MIELEKLRVSLTKNGYLKVADVIKMHPRWEILENLEGTYPGINIKPSQVSNILGVDPTNGQLPPFWDEIRLRGDEAVDAFTLCAIILSHHKLIRVFQQSSQGSFSGQLKRESLSDKEYTNLVYAMATLYLCQSEKGSFATDYDLYRLVYELRECGDLLRKLIASKLERCGWLDPARFAHSNDRDLLGQCKHLRLNTVFAMTWPQFEAWLDNDLEMEVPDFRGRTSVPIAKRRPR